MTTRTSFGILMLCQLVWMAGCSDSASFAPAVRRELPMAILRPAPPMELPGAAMPERNVAGLVDCNNPVHWDGGTMYVFSSIGYADRGEGSDLFTLKRPSIRTHYDNEADPSIGGRWIEATFKHDSGALYGWYHNEPPNVCGPLKRLTAPRIGAVISHDNGLNWKDLGIILTAPPDSLYCETANRYFAGGNGDFSVILDRQSRYFYFLISTYNRDVAEQGVTIARMAFADRDKPVGKVFKWYKGAWGEPGLGGHVTPILPAASDWHQEKVDVFWGPSIHYNAHLDQYVILMNRAIDREWSQEGIYVTFCSDLAKPKGWATPVKVFDGRGFAPRRHDWWYPQVIGIDASNKETDKLAGRVARFFIRGKSAWEIVFLRPGEKL
ncbi:MAG: hypothetical protein QUV05_15790 [Phycisphaerae bacterium]|nr:hypothetical protein [Phycisphaerae bacterium]